MQFLFLILMVWQCWASSNINLPDSHLYNLGNCGETGICKSCWGYEDGCQARVEYVQCKITPNYYIRDVGKLKEEFWRGGDFGYVESFVKSQRYFCRGALNSSWLKCSHEFYYCYGQKLMLDLRKIDISESTDRYNSYLLHPGAIVGNCTKDESLLKVNNKFNGFLQTWYEELRHLQGRQKFSFKHCDIKISKPAMIIKLDALVNMFHHFCDFVNMYASLHVNGSFSDDIQLILWDTSGYESHDAFEAMFSVFTQHPLLWLRQLQGKRICVEQAMFSLLPRMPFGGLFYNMPLVPGCSNSSLMRAFNELVVHRLQLQQRGPLADHRLRVTFLERNSAYRNVLNQARLLDELAKLNEFDIRLVDYNPGRMSFVEQAQISYNSDIFIGMHGAGLTHVLLQPHWGALIELYHCDDPDCYHNLARLRGVRYFTFTNMSSVYPEDEGHHPQLGPHKKFTNYSFEPAEFVSLVQQAAKYVRTNSDYRAAYRAKHRRATDEL